MQLRFSEQLVPHLISRSELKGAPLQPTTLASTVPFTTFRKPDAHTALSLKDGLPWSKLFSYRFRKSDHINILEEIARRSTMKRLAPNHRFWNRRFGHLLDGAAVLGASAKGRSTSWRTNQSHRLVLPCLLLCNMFPCAIWTPPLAMPADDLSRI